MNPIYSPFFQLPLVRGAIILPALICVWYLLRLWRESGLYGVQEAVFTVWFVVSLVVELVTNSTATWIAGFVAQVVLAIVLVFKHQIDEI
jgi:hypothetical protein